MDRTEQQQIENLPEQRQPTARDAESVKGGIIVIGGTLASISDGTSNTLLLQPASPQLFGFQGGCSADKHSGGVN